MNCVQKTKGARRRARNSGELTKAVFKPHPHKQVFKS